MDEWVNVGTERTPRFEHLHADGTRHKSDRTIPMLSVASETPRHWCARFICRRCGADREQPVSSGGRKRRSIRRDPEPCQVHERRPTGRSHRRRVPFGTCAVTLGA